MLGYMEPKHYCSSLKLQHFVMAEMGLLMLKLATPGLNTTVWYSLKPLQKPCIILDQEATKLQHCLHCFFSQKAKSCVIFMQFLEKSEFVLKIT